MKQEQVGAVALLVGHLLSVWGWVLAERRADGMVTQVHVKNCSIGLQLQEEQMGWQPRCGSRSAALLTSICIPAAAQR